LSLAAAPLLVIAIGCGDSGTSSSGGDGGTSSSGTTTAMSSSTGVPPVDPTDKCPGNAVTLDYDQGVVLAGTTVGATDDSKEFCGDSGDATSAPDVVFQVKIVHTCSFTMNLDDMGFDAAVAIRKTCDTRDAGADSCINLLMDGETTKQELAAGTYYVIVDGAAAGAAGSFKLTLDCATPKCGDGILNSAEEQCDPGPADPNDSCGDPGQTDGCKIQTAPAADTCADVMPVMISPGAATFIPASPPLVSSLQGNDDYESPDCSFVGMGAPDQVFEFVPTANGTLSITIGANYNGEAYCQPPNTQPECFIHTMWFKTGDCVNAPEDSCVFSDFTNDNNVNTIQATVTAGTPYFLFVEGNSGSTAQFENGPYLLKATLN